MTDRLVICDTCAELGATAQGAAWAKTIQARVTQAGLDFEVVTTSCLNMCDTPNGFAVQGEGKATYLFAGAAPGQDDADLVELLRLYSQTPDGWITDARTAGRLRECLRGRVPAL